MTTPPKVVKLETSQGRQPLRMKSQAQDVEDVIKVSAKEKKKAEPITEDKKAEQKNDEKKSPARRKVKIRKRKQREKIADLSDQLREAQNIVEALKQKPEDQRHHVDLDHFEKKSAETITEDKKAEQKNERKSPVRKKVKIRKRKKREKVADLSDQLRET